MGALTVTAVGTFYSPPGLATTQTGRQSCEIQYLGVAQLPTNGSLSAGAVSSLGFVFFGTAAPLATAAAFVVPVFGRFDCDLVNGQVEADAVWVASNVTSGIFVYKVK